MARYFTLLLLSLTVSSIRAQGASDSVARTSDADSVENTKGWLSHGRGRGPQIILGAGAGFTSDTKYNPIFFPHWEGSAGVGFLKHVEVLYRSEVSYLADPFDISDLHYEGVVWVQSLAVRYYPTKDWFVVTGFCLATMGTDSATGLWPNIDLRLGPSFDKTSAILIGGGYCSTPWYVEARQYLGLRKIHIYDRPPVSFGEFVISGGIQFRIGSY